MTLEMLTWKTRKRRMKLALTKWESLQKTIGCKAEELNKNPIYMRISKDSWIYEVGTVGIINM